MKNVYEHRGDTVAIRLNRRTGLPLETVIDASDLDLASSYGGTWFAAKNPTTGAFYVRGNVPTPTGQAMILLHRLLLDPPSGMVIDHINGDTLDNRRSNLRVVTVGQNNQNLRGARRGNASGIRGVTKHTQYDKWRARIRVDGKLHHLGVFDDIEEARRVVEEARSRLMPYATS